MALPFGVSFLPNGDEQYMRPGVPGRGASSVPVQQAIKFLSLRVPRVVGQNPLAPISLLTGPGGAGMPPGLLERLIQQHMATPTPPTLPPTSQVPNQAASPPVLPPVPSSPTVSVPPLVPSAGPAPMAAPFVPSPRVPAGGPTVSGAPSPAQARPMTVAGTQPFALPAGPPPVHITPGVGNAPPPTPAGTPPTMAGPVVPPVMPSLPEPQPMPQEARRVARQDVAPTPQGRTPPEPNPPPLVVPPPVSAPFEPPGAPPLPQDDTELLWRRVQEMLRRQF